MGVIDGWPKPVLGSRTGAEPEPPRKADNGKPRWDLLPFDALDEVAAVLAHGAVKYSDRNWEKGLAWGRIAAALLRHLAAWMRGIELDHESGHHHLAHVGACALMLLATVQRKIGVDDRRLR